MNALLALTTVLARASRLMRSQIKVEGDLSVLDRSPLELLNPDRKEVKRGNNDHSLDTKSLSLVVLRLARPVQESGHVLSHLGSGSWSAILVLNKVVKQNSTHRNGTTWEVWVVVGSWRQLDTCWWLVWVTGQQGEDVVTSTVSGLDNQREVRRQGTLVGSSGSLFVGVWAWDVVSKLTRSLLRVTLVIRLIVILKLLAHGSNLVLSVRHSHKSSPSDSVKGVAGSANLSVNLETSSDRGMVKSLEHAVVGPSVFRSVQSVLGSSHGLGSLRVLVKNVSGTKTNSSNNTLHSFLGVWRNTGCSGGEGSQSQWTPQ